MVRTQIQLTNEQAERLRRLASKRRVSMAELIRRSVDSFLDGESNRLDPDAISRARKAVGFLKGAPPDLSRNHDDYLAEALSE